MDMSDPQREPETWSDSCEFCGDDEDLMHIRQSIGGRQQRITICPSCAYLLGIERGENGITPRAGDLFAAVLDPTGVGPRDSKICPRCGITYADLRRHGRVGCADCYDVFKTEIDALLHRSAARVPHRGKLPKSLQQVRNLLVEKPELEERLASAVAREDYEEATRIRALIARLDEDGWEDGEYGG
jgi:protein arginine kinase activator